MKLFYWPSYISALQQDAELAHKDANFYQAKLFHAWRTIQAQQKGMQRQARKLKRKDRYIAALESRIDTLQQDKQNAALEYLSLEGQCREMSAELIELRELVGVHKDKRNEPTNPHSKAVKAAGDEATPAAAKSPT